MSVIRRRIAMGVVAFGALLGGLGLSAVPALALETPLSSPPTSVTGTSAVFNGTLQPNAEGEVSTYFYVYKPGPICNGNGILTPFLGPVTGQAIKFSETVTPLEALTEYTYCVVVEGEGQGFLSTPRTFFTTASKPVLVSESSSGVTPYVATLEAKVNPENEPSTSCVFEYGTTAVSEHKAACAPAAVEGSAVTEVKASLTGLEAATPYKYRVVVANKTGKAEGAIETFETLPAVNGGEPVVESEESKEVAQFSATVAAQINPSYRETLCRFEYASNKSVVAEGKGTSVPCNPETIAGSSSSGSGLPASANLTELSPATTYYYRVVAENTTNKKAVDGAIESFKTTPLAAPVIEGESSNPFSPFEATVEAQVNPESQETSCEGFEYASKESVVVEGKGTKVSCNKGNLGKGSTGVSVSATITGLEPGKSYYYRVLVKNATGASAGTIEKFETPVTMAPSIEFSSPVGASPYFLVAEARINPEFQETTCEIEYATEESTLEAEAGAKAACILEKLGNGGGGVFTPGIATKLRPKTEYFYRFVATNKTGRTNGVIQTLPTEPAIAPVIVSESASEVTALHAKLEAVINTNFQETPVTFEYSTEGAAFLEGTAKEVQATPIPPVGPGQECIPAPLCPKSVSVDLGEVLQPNTTYFYRVVAENEISKEAGKPVEGTIEHFTTPAAPALTTAAAQNITEGGATLTGTIAPEGAEAKYHFVYIAQALYEEALKSGGGLTREVDPVLNPYAGGSSTTEVTVPPGEHGVLPVQFTLTGLTPGAAYAYTLVATTTQEENGQMVTTTVVSKEGHTFTVAGELPPPPPGPPVPEYATGPLAGPTPLTPIPPVTVPNIKFPPPFYTNAEKLEMALNACKAKHTSKSKQTACEKQARKKYAAKPKKKSKKKRSKKKKKK